MEWDELPIYQSAHLQLYQEYLQDLHDTDKLYKCYCPRRLVKGRPYPGTCRNQPQTDVDRHSLRVLVKGDPVIFKDMIQGKIQQDITRDSGDFIVVRSDQVFSYNLVAAIDDAHGITHVIRGADLLDTTPKQVYLQNLLKISTPVYGHIPVAVNKDGKKLSKQHGAIDVLDEYTPAQALVRALKFLGQPIDNGLSQAPPDTIIQWALENWSLELIPKLASIQI